MDEVFVVRHKVLVEKQSVRRVAREMGIARNTVRRYLRGAVPGVRRGSARPQPVTDKVLPRIEEILADSARWTTRKQRLTATQLHKMLLGEGHKVSSSTVRALVHEWKRKRKEVFVPLTYKPGDLGEVDFFEVVADVGGVRQKAWMFVLRLMHSGRDFAWLYPRQDQVCFLDGHVRAFEHFGAVPHRLAYDNLRAAVAKMLAGSERELSARFLALTTHYVFEASFARPRTGHDKGGVEARGKGIRLQELVPIPAGDSLAAISAGLLARLDARMHDTRDADGRSIDDRFAVEREHMLPLPGGRFVAAAFRSPTVTRRSLVQVEGAYYSVWSAWAGLDVSAYVGVDTVELVGPDMRRVVHARQRFGRRSVDYRHYMRELGRKPQALRQVADELMRDLGAPFDALWQRLVDERGPKQAAQVFAHVLRAIEDAGVEAAAARVAHALESGEHVLFALRPPPAPTPSLAELPPSLVGIEVTTGAAADYDQLLRGAA